MRGEARAGRAWPPQARGETRCHGAGSPPPGARWPYRRAGAGRRCTPRYRKARAEWHDPPRAAPADRGCHRYAVAWPAVVAIPCCLLPWLCLRWDLRSDTSTPLISAAQEDNALISLKGHAIAGAHSWRAQRPVHLAGEAGRKGLGGGVRQGSAQAPKLSPPTEPELARSLSLLKATLYGLGVTIGAGNRHARACRLGG